MNLPNIPHDDGSAKLDRAQLLIQGKATGPVWVLDDGTEPHVIGMRLDKGDAGVVYLTRDQALELGIALLRIADTL